MKKLKTLKNKAWKLVSIHVRKSSADWRGYAKCYTCGTVKQWKELQCGHYIHNKLDLDLRNLKPQCVRCNKFLRGNLGIYAEKLIRDNGLEWIIQLRKDANLKGNNYSIQEVETIIKWLKDLE